MVAQGLSAAFRLARPCCLLHFHQPPTTVPKCEEHGWVCKVIRPLLPQPPLANWFCTALVLCPHRAPITATLMGQASLASIPNIRHVSPCPLAMCEVLTQTPYRHHFLCLPPYYSTPVSLNLLAQMKPTTTTNLFYLPTSMWQLA